MHAPIACLILLAPIPTNQPIGTAAVGSQSTIEAVGSMTLSAKALNGQEFLQSLPQVLGVPSFARRSCSPHAFRALGYEAIHSVGKYLCLIHLASGIQYEFPIHIMHGNTDFIALRINAVTDLPTTVTHRVSAINLSDRLKGASLCYLLHFRFGCHITVAPYCHRIVQCSECSEYVEVTAICTTI